MVLIRFDYNTGLIEQVKKFPGRRWSQTKLCWYIPASDFHLDTFKSRILGIADIDTSNIKDYVLSDISSGSKKKSVPPKLPKGYLETLEQKRYALSTIKIYTSNFRQFVEYFSGQLLEEVTVEQINDYLLKLIHEESMSPSKQNQLINTIKFYYEKVLGRETQYYKIDRPRNTKALPKVITEDELFKMLETASNNKNKLIIGLIYSAGLRRGEMINLRKEDIITSKKMIFKPKYTHVSKKSLANIKSPLDRFFESKKLDNNELKKST